MNLDVVRKCAEIAARMQVAALGAVDEEVAQLLADLDAAAAPAPEEAPVEAPAKAKKAKAA